MVKSQFSWKESKIKKKTWVMMNWEREEMGEMNKWEVGKRRRVESSRKKI